MFEEWRSGPNPGIRIPMSVYSAMREDRFLPVADLDEGFMRPSYPEQVIVSYMQAGLVCDFIDRRHGEHKLREMLEAFRDGLDTEQALRTVFGMEPAEFDREFDAFVTAGYGEILDQLEDSGVAMALAADVTRPERRSVIMAVIGIGIGASFLVSMMASVPLATLLGLRGLFWLTAVFAVVGMGLVLSVPSVPQHAEAASGVETARIGPVWLLAVSVFLLHAVMTLLFVTFPPMLVDRFGLALAEHWKIYVPTMLLSVLIVFPALRRMGRSLSEHRFLPWAFGALAVSMIAMPHSPAWLALGAVVTLYFLGFNLLESAMPAVLSRLTGSRGRGRKMGLYSTFQFLGAFFGGVIGGGLLAQFGSETALLFAGLLCGLWGLLLGRLFSGVFPTGAAT